MRDLSQTEQKICSDPTFIPCLQGLTIGQVLNWKEYTTSFVAKNSGKIRELLSKNEKVELLVNGLGSGKALLEAFHGYIFLSNPDGGVFGRTLSKEKAGAPYYGIAITDTFGKIHYHKKSPAFNLILGGEGRFKGNIQNCNEGSNLTPGTELHIQQGATHGHEVIGKGPLIFFALQLCGFQKGSPCEGDFHIT